MEQTVEDSTMSMPGEQLDGLNTGEVEEKKFDLLADLGTIVVPEDYNHETALTTFKRKNQGKNNKKFSFYNDSITDANFPNPSRILLPGDELRVRLFRQIGDGITLSEERMAFLSSQRAVYTGAQGLALVFEQMRDQLPKGMRYSSFDELDRLWRNDEGYHQVPSMDAYLPGTFSFYFGDFGYFWRNGRAFFCFNEL